MKKMIKATLGLFLAIMTILGCATPIFAAEAAAISEENSFAVAIEALKKEYPQNYYWNEYNGTDSKGIAKAGTVACKGKSTTHQTSCVSNGYCAKGGSCSCACGYYHGWQCFGFANLLAYKTLGSWATNNYYSSGVNTSAGWKYYKSVSQYYAGDFVRINNSHTIFIYKVEGSTVYYAECNATGACKINWNGQISVSSLKSKTTFVVHKTGNTLKGTGIASVGTTTGVDLATFNTKLDTFKTKKYAHGSTYVDNPSLTGGYQCFGFANELAKNIFGSYPTNSMSAKTVNAGWTCTYGGDAVDNLCVGDIVRFEYHSIFITGISGDTIYYCQANIPAGTNKVTYENSISRSDLKTLVAKKLTSPDTDKPGWVAHYTDSKIESSDALAKSYYANLKDGIYTFKSVSSGKYMGVQNAKNADGTNVLTYDYQNTDAFKFYVQHVENGKYLIYSLASKSGSTYERVLDVWTGVYGGTPEYGDRIDIYQRTSTENKCQLFYINEQPNGSYVIELVSVPGLVVASKNKLNADTEGGAMTARTYRGYTTQQWFLCDETGARVDASIDAPTGEGNDYSLGVFRVTPSIGLNIRSGAGTKYSKVGAIPYNVNISITDVSGNWGKTSYGGISGWVCMDYLERASISSNSSAVKYKVNADGGLRIRENAGTSYKALGLIPNGKQIYITTIKNNWGYTTYGEVSGWVSMDYVTKVTTDSGNTGSGSSGSTSGGTGTNQAPTDEGENLAFVRNQVSGITSAKISIKGPSVEFYGKDFNLFAIDGKINFNIGNLKVVQDEDDPNTLKVLIGFDEGSSANISGAENDKSYWKNAYKEVKQLYTDTTGKKVDNTRLWNRFSALRGKLKQNNASMLIDVDATMMGFVEFKWNGEEFVFSEGGIMASFSGRVEYKHTVVPKPAEVYASVGLKAGLDSKLSLECDENGNIIPNAIVHPYLTLDVGIGGTVDLLIWKLAHVEGRLYGTVESDIDLTGLYSKPDSVKLYLSAKARLEASLLWLEAEPYEHDFGKVQIYPIKTRAMMLAMAAEEGITEQELLNQLTPINRGYLNAPVLFALRNSDPSAFEKSYVYPNNAVSLVRFDNDTMLLVWIEDTGEKNTNNIGTLAYSFYDGECWSDTVYLFENGVGNDTPVVYSDGSRAYILWRRAIEELGEDAQPTDVITKYDLFASVFDSANGTVTDPIRITNNALFETNYQIIGKDGDFTVLWLENDKNHLEEGSVNTLYTVTYSAENGTLSAPVAHVSTECSIGSAFLYGDTVCYTLEEAEQQALYYTAADEAVLLCENIGSLQVLNNVVFYTEEGVLKSFDGSVVAEYPIANLSEFKIVSDGTLYYVFTTQTNEHFGTDLYYCTVDPSTHEATGFELYASNEDRYIRNYSPVVLSDGTLKVAFNYIQTESEEYKIATITVVDKMDGIDFAVDYIDFDDESLDEETVELSVHIQNNSSAALQNFIVDIYNENGELLHSVTVECPVEAFGEGLLTFDYAIPAGYNSERLTFTVSSADHTDHYMQNNSITTTLESFYSSEEPVCEHSYPSGKDKCTLCGHYRDGIASLYGYSISLKGDISINFYFDVTEETKNDAGAYILITYPDGTTEKILLREARTKTAGDVIYYVINPTLSAKEINSIISARVVLSDGTEGILYEKSIRGYAEALIANASSYSAEQVALMEALIAYGEAASTYFGGETAEHQMTEITAETLEAYEIQKSGSTDAGMSYYGSSVLLESETTIRHYFKLTSGDITDHTFLLDGEVVTPVNETGTSYWYIDVPNIVSKDLDKVYVLEADGMTIEYSALSYAYAVLNAYGNDAAKGAMCNAVRALYEYNRAANAYFEK